MKNRQSVERRKKQTSLDLIPKTILAEARNIVFSFPELSYEGQLKKLQERVYGNSVSLLAVSPSHLPMALNEARKVF